MGLRPIAGDLEPDNRPTWLGEVEGDSAVLLKPTAEVVLKVGLVSRGVNSPKNNGAV